MIMINYEIMIVFLFATKKFISILLKDEYYLFKTKINNDVSHKQI